MTDKNVRKLAVNPECIFPSDLERALKTIKESGFDGCFICCNSNGSDIEKKAELIAKNGLIFQSVHAPFGNVHTLWEEGEAGERETDLLIDCLKACERAGAPIMTVHPIIGMDRHTPCELGIKRFSRLVEEAEKTSVKLAFENVECLEYLDMVFDRLGDSDAVRLCWDTGHEMCYNFSTDIPGRFSGKLITTHFNDNLGITDPSVVTWLDDAHLLPFDGIADWKGIMDRIRRENFTDILTFEFSRNSKPGKNTHDIYAHLSDEKYMALAYEKACKVAAL